MTVEDAQLAVKHKVPAIILSNHGARQLDGAPSSLEVALEIHQQAPQVFKQTEVLADGGVRYGADALLLLSLGVKAVGLGRPFMYANVYGQPGVEKAIEIMKHEIAIDAGNVGVADLKKITPKIVSCFFLLSFDNLPFVFFFPQTDKRNNRQTGIPTGGSCKKDVDLLKSCVYIYRSIDENIIQELHEVLHVYSKVLYTDLP